MLVERDIKVRLTSALRVRGACEVQARLHDEAVYCFRGMVVRGWSQEMPDIRT